MTKNTIQNILSIIDNKTFLRKIYNIVEEGTFSVDDIHPLMCVLERLQRLGEITLGHKLIENIDLKASSFRLYYLANVAALNGRYPDCVIFLKALLECFGALEFLSFDVFKKAAKQQPAIQLLLDFPFVQGDRTYLLFYFVNNIEKFARLASSCPDFAEHLLSEKDGIIYFHNRKTVLRLNDDVEYSSKGTLLSDKIAGLKEAFTSYKIHKVMHAQTSAIVHCNRQDKSIVREIKAFPNSAEWTLFCKRKEDHISKGKHLAEIIIACPNLAKRLLFSFIHPKFSCLLDASSSQLANIFAVAPDIRSSLKPYLFLINQPKDVAIVLHASVAFCDEQAVLEQNSLLPHQSALDRMWPSKFSFSPEALEKFVHTLEDIATPNAYFLAAYALIGNIRPIEWPDYVDCNSGLDEYNEKRILDAMTFFYKALTMPGLAALYKKEAELSLYDFAPSEHSCFSRRIHAYYKQIIFAVYGKLKISDFLSSHSVSFFNLKSGKNDNFDIRHKELSVHYLPLNQH